MYDVGDLPVLTFGNCALKAGVIKWPVKLYVRFFKTNQEGQHPLTGQRAANFKLLANQ